MFDLFHDIPGRLFVAATLLPLLAAIGLLLAGTVRRLNNPITTLPLFASPSGLPPQASPSGLPPSAGGLRGVEPSTPPQPSPQAGREAKLPTKVGGYVTLLAMIAATVCAITGLVTFLNEPHSDPTRWAERTDWLHIGASKLDKPSTALQFGYRVDRLSAVMVTMVTVVTSLIMLFSIGYMADEAKPVVDDHAIHHKRRGRFGEFFLYLSLFAFSMLNLLIADNLMQVFIGWELVGVSSFFLIGFYSERPTASTAANKAFIVNRIGDAGFLVGIAIAWTTFGTLNIQELIANFDGGRPASLTDSLWLVMGLGIFLGCVGKSAQFPLHTWLPDAMEGPTPVSALIHAATMVAAGVYLVGRCYPLFSPDCLLVIAYTGAVTLFLAATIATVMTDIKRVLAYSTMSQLGYMMLALGIGAWTAALFHLLTHAFFKALLFLGSGSVIHGLHHEQDLRKMGGLRRKMPVTAGTMLVGVLTISGTPLLSGWYSKDQILSASLGYGLAHDRHILLFVIPLVTAMLTAYYMFRLWFLAFAGAPRDHHVHDHAHESPRSMTVPLIVLATFSVGIGWGWPLWDAEASMVSHYLHAAEPNSSTDFHTARELAEHNHLLAGRLALLAAGIGAFSAYTWHRSGSLISTGQPSSVRKLLENKWYFDELYAALFLRPIVNLGSITAASDKRPASDTPLTFDYRTLDGVLNAVGDSLPWLGQHLRRVQTGNVRNYVLFLALTVVGLLGMLAAFIH